jgi:hypothetical protein
VWRWLAALALVGALALVIGCGGGDGNDRPAAGPPAAGETVRETSAETCERVFQQAQKEPSAIEPTILACPDVATWRAAATKYPAVLGPFSQDEVLAMTCAAHRGERDFEGFCAGVEGG